MRDDLEKAHKRSIRHKAEIEASATCGCFYCCRTFVPAAIREWTDRDGSGVGQTALCPFCGIDSVLGDRSTFPITPAFLHAMRARWFDR